MKQALHSIFKKNVAIFPIANYKAFMACYPHTHSLSNNWMHFKRNFAYTIKETETSIRDNEVTVSRDMIPFTFLNETQRTILRLNKSPPFLRRNFQVEWEGLLSNIRYIPV